MAYFVKYPSAGENRPSILGSFSPSTHRVTVNQISPSGPKVILENPIFPHEAGREWVANSFFSGSYTASFLPTFSVNQTRPVESIAIDCAELSPSGNATSLIGVVAADLA